MQEATTTTDSIVAREEHQLVLLERAKAALAEATSIEEVLEIRDQVSAFKAYAQKKKLGEEHIRLVNEMLFRAQRRLGEFTHAMDKAPSGRAAVRARDSSPSGGLETKAAALKAAGVKKQDASRCEAIAAIPEKQFEAEVQVPGATVKRLVGIGRAQRAKRPRSKLQSAHRFSEPGVSDRMLVQRARLYQARIEKVTRQYVQKWPAEKPTALLVSALRKVADALEAGEHLG